MSKTSKGNDVIKKDSSKIMPYVFTLPGMLLFFLIAVVPVFQTVLLSLTDWNGVTQLNDINMVGIDNYKYVLSSDEFRIAIKNNIKWAVVGTTIPVAIGLIQAAVIVNSEVKFKNLFLLILFLPQILSSMIMSIMWLAIYDPASGLLNSILELIGLGSLASPWLGQKETAFNALLVMSVWTGYGFNTVIYSSAIRAVDQSMYEAAKIDGATSIQQFFKITIPSVTKTTTTILLLALIGSFKVYDTVAQMTKGGPGYYTYVISYDLYQTAFISNKIGVGCAIAVLLTVIVFIVSRVFLKIRGDE